MVKPGDEVEIIGFEDTRKTTVTGVEMFRKLLDQGEAGDNVGCLLRGIDKEDVQRGQVLAAPGSVTPHTHFDGEVYVLKKEEGGRHKPFFDGYRPQFYMRTTDVTGSIKLPEDVKMVMPGDNVQMKVELITPVAMEGSSASPSARAAARSALASSPRSPIIIRTPWAIGSASRSYVTSAARATTRRPSQSAPFSRAKRARHSGWPSRNSAGRATGTRCTESLARSLARSSERREREKPRKRE
ncbi:MAG: hypothetical protein SangKO_024040 [Sandaracinaceae bacterium]